MECTSWYFTRLLARSLEGDYLYSMTHNLQLWWFPRLAHNRSNSLVLALSSTDTCCETWLVDMDTTQFSYWTTNYPHSLFAYTAPLYLSFIIQNWDQQHMILELTMTSNSSTRTGHSFADAEPLWFPQWSPLHLLHPPITVGTHTHCKLHEEI